MREKIYLYLLVFVFVILVFLYKFQSSVFDRQQEDNLGLEKVLRTYKERNKDLEAKLLDANYFSLEQNENALSYLEEVYKLHPDSLKQKIENHFYSKNGTVDNSLVPYAGMQGIMQINKVKLINHKWAVVDFTDGTYWGEMLAAYFYTPETDLVEIEVLNSFLYTTN